MIKIPRLNYAARNLLSFSSLQYMFDTVAEKPQFAEIYVDDEEKPRDCALLFGHYLFINEADEDFIGELYATAFSEEKQKALGALIIFYDGDSTSALLKKTFSKVYPGERSLYQYHDAHIRKKTERVIPVTEKLFGSKLDHIDMITGEVLGTATYDNMEDFCRNGIGYTFVDRNRICAFCTSEYPSKSSLATGIEVEAGYQRQGIATEMTNAFLTEALNRKLNVFWECWKDNEASVRTALKCGFRKLSDYPVLFVDMRQQPDS